MCGEGVRRRAVTCFKAENGTVAALEDAECAGLERPADEEPCQAEEESCAAADWIVSDWTKCDDKCGEEKRGKYDLGK